jgi:hypothetical protein
MLDGRQRRGGIPPPEQMRYRPTVLPNGHLSLSVSLLIFLTIFLYVYLRSVSLCLSLFSIGSTVLPNGHLSLSISLSLSSSFNSLSLCISLLCFSLSSVLSISVLSPSASVYLIHKSFSLCHIRNIYFSIF